MTTACENSPILHQVETDITLKGHPVALLKIIRETLAMSRQAMIDEEGEHRPSYQYLAAEMAAYTGKVPDWRTIRKPFEGQADRTQVAVLIALLHYMGRFDPVEAGFEEALRQAVEAASSLLINDVQAAHMPHHEKKDARAAEVVSQVNALAREAW